MGNGNPSPDLDPNEEFWRLPAVINRVGLSRSEIYRRMREGTFPRSRKYRDQVSVFWLASDVRRWQAIEVQQAEQKW